MIGLLIVAHAPLASALKACALHVYGSLDRMEACDVEAGIDPVVLDRLLREAVLRLDAGAGVLVMTDIFGATPCNIASKLAAPGKVALLAGVNTPMLLRSISYRHLHLEPLVEKALGGATQGVMRIASTAPQNQTLKKTDDALSRYQHQQ
jgi:PTS system mannose-specific IIA component